MLLSSPLPPTPTLRPPPAHPHPTSTPTPTPTPTTSHSPTPLPQLDPERRITPKEALRHPFIKQPPSMAPAK